MDEELPFFKELASASLVDSLPFKEGSFHNEGRIDQLRQLGHIGCDRDPNSQGALTFAGVHVAPA